MSTQFDFKKSKRKFVEWYLEKCLKHGKSFDEWWRSEGMYHFMLWAEKTMRKNIRRKYGDSNTIK